MKTVEALMPFAYDSVDRKIGERFQIADEHVQVLTLHNRVKEVAAPKFETAAFKAEDNSTQEDERPTKKREYRRRDMRPEQ